MPGLVPCGNAPASVFAKRQQRIVRDAPMRASSMAWSQEISKPSWPGKVSVTARCPALWSGSCDPSWNAACWPTASCVCTAPSAAGIGSFLIRARAAPSVLPAAAAAWPKPLFTLLIASFPRCRSGSGCCRCPFRCATAWPTTRPWSGMFCRPSCVPYSPWFAAGQAFPRQTGRPVAVQFHLSSASGMP